MIKVNLLPQRKAKRASADPSSKHIAVGAIALAGAAVVVFFAVDKPQRDKLREFSASNDQIQSEINSKNQTLAGYAELKTAADEADKRAASINHLISAKVVPAHVLHELGEILSAGHLPTMTEDMAKQTGNGPDSNPNKRFALDWDPTHVWLSGFTDAQGAFKIEGGAQSESDVTQLSKRLAASVYFMEVSPAGGERVADASNGINYYKFTITGKVAY